MDLPAILAEHFSVIPIGPQETKIVSKWIVRRDAVEGMDYRIENLIEVWTKTNQQDRELAENNQRGVNSIGYRPAVLGGGRGLCQPIRRMVPNERPRGRLSSPAGWFPGEVPCELEIFRVELIAGHSREASLMDATGNINFDLPQRASPDPTGEVRGEEASAHRLRIGFRIRVVILINNVAILTAGEGPSWEYRAQTTSMGGAAADRR